jgi:hypothetical protein
MKCINKELLIHNMDTRLKSLEFRHQRDFSGGVQSDIFTIRELKFWKECLERGEYDLKEDSK